MILIHTPYEDLSKNLKEMIPDADIAYYPEYLLEDNTAEIVILTYNIKPQIPLKDFLFLLRKDDKRVILLLDSRENPVLGFALALGIYDITFGQINISDIADMVKNPRKFSDVAHLFTGLSQKVEFNPEIAEEEETVIEEKEEGKTETSSLKFGKIKLPNLKIRREETNVVKPKITGQDSTFSDYRVKAIAVLGTGEHVGSTAFTVALAKHIQDKGYNVRIVDAGGGSKKWLEEDKSIECTENIGVIPGQITLFDMGNNIADGVLPLVQTVFIITDSSIRENPTLIMPYVKDNTYLIGNKGVDEDVVYAMADFKMVKALFTLPEAIELIKAQQEGIAIVPKKWQKKLEKIIEIINQEG